MKSPIAGPLNLEGHHAFLYINEPYASEEVYNLYTQMVLDLLSKRGKHLQQMHRQGIRTLCNDPK